MSAAVEQKVVPESILKKRKREEQWALEKKEALEKKRQDSREKKKVIVRKARQYAEEYEAQVSIMLSMLASINFLDCISISKQVRWPNGIDWEMRF